MKSVARPEALGELVERLRALTPDSERQWGTLTPGEMLCHLGDATASVMKRASADRDSAKPTPPLRPVMKWVALRSPLRWPPGLKTPRYVDPRVDGTKPGDFETDRERAIKGLVDFAAAPPDALARSHGAFGRMSHDDWHRWAYRHTDHHLRQFGL